MHKFLSFDRLGRSNRLRSERRGDMARLLGLLLAALGFVAAGRAMAEPPTHLQVVGGLAGIAQYKQYEEPFWSEKIGVMSKGRIQASIRPFDRSGLQGQDMLGMLRLGVVPFGTVILSVVAGDEPELSAVDLPGLNPDIGALRTSVSVYRPHLAQALAQRYGIELLGVYAYPAQVVFCKGAIGNLEDLRGKRVRTSSVAQSEFVSALGAEPVITPFAEIVDAVSGDVVDCAITGTLSGNEIGLSDVTTHVHEMAISWGVAIFGANQAAWQALPKDLQEIVRSGIVELEEDIWRSAERETVRGIACDIGADGCNGGNVGHMTLVPVSTADDELRRKLLIDVVLPRWIDRCGSQCIATWNRTLAPVAHVTIPSR